MENYKLSDLIDLLKNNCSEDFGKMRKPILDDISDLKNSLESSLINLLFLTSEELLIWAFLVPCLLRRALVVFLVWLVYLSALMKSWNLDLYTCLIAVASILQDREQSMLISFPFCYFSIATNLYITYLCRYSLLFRPLKKQEISLL